ncbi:hypothetical protein C4D60_Mb09t18190 [Musa balbisiana]|uniref:Uncharacterized protein n=1 Tax=Musa balbisiana TaxID=52838 RepID=A0A4S8IJR7_MUSBA|nr:hypothetical protein C4D60_Mb09t18190 [Musa balbisiana]
MAGDEEAKPETRWFRRRSPQVQLDKLRGTHMSVKTSEETPDVENTDTSVTTVGASSSSPTSKERKKEEKKKKGLLDIQGESCSKDSTRARVMCDESGRAKPEASVTYGGERSFREEGSEGTKKEEGRLASPEEEEVLERTVVKEQKRKKEEREKKAKTRREGVCIGEINNNLRAGDIQWWHH